MPSVKAVAAVLVHAARWAERVRPPGWVALLVLWVASVLLQHFLVTNSLTVSVIVGAFVLGLYLFPWLVKLAENFAAGYRGDQPTTTSPAAGPGGV